MSQENLEEPRKNVNGVPEGDAEIDIENILLHITLFGRCQQSFVSLP